MSYQSKSINTFSIIFNLRTHYRPLLTKAKSLGPSFPAPRGALITQSPYHQSPHTLFIFSAPHGGSPPVSERGPGLPAPPPNSLIPGREGFRGGPGMTRLYSAIRWKILPAGTSCPATPAF